MKKIISFIFCIVVVFSLHAIVFGQNQISENKKKLIAEMIVLTKIDKQVSQITDILLNSMEKSYLLGFNQVVDSRNDLTKIAKERLKSEQNKSYLNFSKKFRERLPQAINYTKYIEDSVYPIYDKFFSETELSDLVAFYKTPTGQKVIDTMPQLYKESTELAQTNLLPQVMKLLNEIVKEDLDNVKKLK